MRERRGSDLDIARHFFAFGIGSIFHESRWSLSSSGVPLYTSVVRVSAFLWIFSSDFSMGIVSVFGS
jgi:hypothetical protein